MPLHGFLVQPSQWWITGLAGAAPAFLLLYDYVCYGWLGPAYMLVELQAHTSLMTLLGLLPPCTIQIWLHSPVQISPCCIAACSALEA